jgi:hypothetical protein
MRTDTVKLNAYDDYMTKNENCNLMGIVQDFFDYSGLKLHRMMAEIPLVFLLQHGCMCL